MMRIHSAEEKQWPGCCFVCHATEDLRTNMFIDDGNSLICSPCVEEWYDGRHESWDSVKRARMEKKREE